MKKLFYTFILLIVILVTCVVTCPDRQAHVDAVVRVVNSSLNENMDTDEADDWSMLGTIIGSKIVNAMLDQRLEINNYFVCSVGQIAWKGKNKTVSIGVLNHVFTFEKDDLTNTLDEANRTNK